jgi:hypothetical protein
MVTCCPSGSSIWSIFSVSPILARSVEKVFHSVL